MGTDRQDSCGHTDPQTGRRALLSPEDNCGHMVWPTLLLLVALLLVTTHFVRAHRSDGAARPPTVPALRLSGATQRLRESSNHPPLLRRRSARRSLLVDESANAVPVRFVHEESSVAVRRPTLQRRDAQYFETPDSSNSDIVELLPRIQLSGTHSLPTLRTENDDTCVICLEDYQDGDTVACLPCAGLHKSHWHCIRRWLNSAHSCPSCRWGLPSGAACPDDIHALMAKGHNELQRISPTQAHGLRSTGQRCD